MVFIERTGHVTGFPFDTLPLRWLVEARGHRQPFRQAFFGVVLAYSLGFFAVEGNTNLFWVERFGHELGMSDVWVKQ